MYADVFGDLKIYMFLRRSPASLARAYKLHVHNFFFCRYIWGSCPLNNKKPATLLINIPLQVYHMVNRKHALPIATTPCKPQPSRNIRTRLLTNMIRRVNFAYKPPKIINKWLSIYVQMLSH